MLLGLRLLEDSYSYFKKLSLLLKKHIWYMTYTSETGSEAMFCWQYSRSKCKHALSVKSGGRTVGRICSSGPISFSHYISWGSELWAPVCVCVCVCVYDICVHALVWSHALSHSVLLETEPSNLLVLTDSGFCPTKLTRSHQWLISKNPCNIE